MAHTAAKARLVNSEVLVRRLDLWLQEAEEALLAELDELERMQAEDFLRKAKATAVTQWQGIVNGTGHGGAQEPRADTTYVGPDEHAPARAMAEENREDDGSGEGGGFSAQHLQKELSKFCDCTRLRRLESELQQQRASRAPAGAATL